jgi:prepilin-type processing-associated H-X9-DG protein
VIYIAETVEESWEVHDNNNLWGTMRGIRENIETIRASVPPKHTGFDWHDVPGGKSVPTYQEFVSSERAPRASLKMHLGRGSNAVFVDGHVELLKPPSKKVGAPNVMRYYLRQFGVDPDIVDQCTATDTSAFTDPDNHPCAVGDTAWRP